MIDRQQVLPHVIRERARSRPDDAVITAVGGPSTSYGELQSRIMRWAAAFRQLGVSTGDTVVTLLPASVESYCAWLGLSWLGAIEVPVHTMYRGRMLSYIIQDSKAKIIVATGEVLEQVAGVAGELENVAHTVVLDDGDVPSGLPGSVVSFADLEVDPNVLDDLEGPNHYDTAAVIYTSGTTGPSKGVLVPWAELYYLSLVMPADALPPGGAYYSMFPPHHVSGKSALYFAITMGARLVMRERFSPTEFWDDVRAHGCTAAGIFGPLLTMLLMQPEQPNDSDNPMIGMICAPLVERHEEFSRRFGVKLATGYGMSETGAVFMSRGWDITDWRSCGRVRQGPPGFEVRVVDEHDLPLGPGQVGELVVRADEPWVLNAGYLGLPERTAEAWRNGWFHTGDGFRYDEDGNFYFVDRMKDAIRRRAENISSMEVEAYVTSHPEVAECAAFGVPSELGEEEVKVCVVRTEGSELGAEALTGFLEPQMPRFMLPRFIEFVDALPKTEVTMRIRKVELKADPFNERTWDRESAKALA